MNKIFSILSVLWICSCGAQAYFVVEDDYTRQVEVLKNLDIEASFLQDSMFASMAEDMSNYRQKQFLKTLENGAQFIPILRDMIEEAGIPDAFLYMAMAESGFSVKAYSRAKASGIWQFIAGTAKKYNLAIDDYVDERRDPIKSTEAAIKYLHALHDRFGKWYLAAMAYNCGEGRVSRAIEKAGTDDLHVLLDEKAKYLPAETRRYIRKIITMAYLSEDPNFLVRSGGEHLLNGGIKDYAFVSKEILGGSSLADVADALDMQIEDLRAYNQHLNYFFTPPNRKVYHIYIPTDKEPVYMANFDPTKRTSRFDVHVVRKGDSFNKIAKEYKVKYQVIKDFNGIATNMLKPGQKLIIPVVTHSQYYTTKHGDSLYAISTRYKVTVAQLKNANNLKSEIIQPGVRLEIPQYTY